MPNLDQAFLDGLSDDQLTMMVAALPGGGAGATDPLAAPADAMMADMPASREELIAALVALGQDPVAMEGMDDASLQAKWMELTGGQSSMSDTPRGTVNSTATTATTTQRPTGSTGSTGRQPSKVTLQFAERDAAQIRRMRIEAERERNADKAARDKQLLDAKKEVVSTFCERLVSKGNLLPVHVESVARGLITLDNVNATHNFSEGGKTEKVTPFEAEKRRLLAAKPIIRFGEKIQGAGGDPKSDQAAEVEKVRRFSETTLMQDALKSAGKKPSDYVHSFSERIKKDPEFTAAKYGVPEEYAAA